MAWMYFLPQLRDQGHTSLRIRHDLVSLLRLDSSMQVGHLVIRVVCNASHLFLDIVAPELILTLVARSTSRGKIGNLRSYNGNCMENVSL